MFLRVFTIYDKKAAAYLTPFFMRTNAEAIRAVQQTASSRESNFSKYPEDFQLVVIGEFDDLTGVVTPKGHEVLAEVNDLVLTMRDRFEQEAG